MALLIGNKGYSTKVGQLKNPHNDIALVGKSLEQTGFKVTALRDADRLMILTAVDDFSEKLGQAGAEAIGFLYYSGHGAAETEAGPNYLIPVDVKDTDTKAVWHASVRLDDVVTRLQRGAPLAAHFVIFDACRNELQLQHKGGAKGFVPVFGQPGMFISFSTSPNRRALDEGDNSGPYAAALATELMKPSQHHHDLFFNVKQSVVQKTQAVGEQRPWEQDGLTTRVYFGR
jgi:uncharacterized caspase-like protein